MEKVQLKRSPGGDHYTREQWVWVKNLRPEECEPGRCGYRIGFLGEPGRVIGKFHDSELLRQAREDDVANRVLLRRSALRACLQSCRPFMIDGVEFTPVPDDSSGSLYWRIHNGVDASTVKPDPDRTAFPDEFLEQIEDVAMEAFAAKHNRLLRHGVGVAALQEA